MKKWAIAAVIVAGLALSGCSAGTAETEESPATPSAEESASNPPAETITPTPTPDTGSFGLGDMTPDEFFIKIMETTWLGDSRPEDATLIRLAQDACTQVTTGTEWRSVTVYPEDTENNGRLVQNAIDVYCPGNR